jgi:hypothetical protein
MAFLSDDNGETYNKCHCEWFLSNPTVINDFGHALTTSVWSNFEIGSLKFWRSQAYMDFFEHLDQAGGFYYERWGDAPVHSIGAALFAKKEQIHFFDDIGYRHEPFQVSLCLTGYLLSGVSHLTGSLVRLPAQLTDDSTAHKEMPTQEGTAGVTRRTTLIGNGECFE